MILLHTPLASIALFGTLWGALWHLPPPAHAGSNDCGLRLSASNVNVIWDQNFTFQAVTFTLSKTKGGACNWAVGMTSGDVTGLNYNRRLTSGRDTLAYQVFVDSQLQRVLKDIPDASSKSDFLYGSFSNPANQSVTLTYYFQIPPAQVTSPTLKPSGTYADSVQLRVYSDEGAAAEDMKQINITTTVPKIIDLSLVSPGSAFNSAQTSQSLDFGTLVEGSTKTLDLRVRSNAGYSISVSSANNGSLRHSDTDVRTQVPYLLSVNGSRTNLSSSASNPTTVGQGSGQTSMNGIGLPLSIAIGSVENAMAGKYTDSITVTVTTTE